MWPGATTVGRQNYNLPIIAESSIGEYWIVEFLYGVIIYSNNAYGTMNLKRKSDKLYWQQV